MSWDTATTDLRVILSDGPTDKLRAFKTVFGIQNGVNTTYKTFEFRRVSDFSSSALPGPLGLQVDGVRIPAASVVSDDLDSGIFVLTDPLQDSQQFTATYYIQWFKDDELTGFLLRSSNWLGLGDDYTQIPSGLKTAALKYAAHEAYQKLSLRMSENIVETYRLQDAPDDKRMAVVAAYQKAASDSLKEAITHRDDFYTRKGQAKAPRFGVISGNIKNPTVS